MLWLPNNGHIFSATLFFAFALFIAYKSFGDEKISSFGEVFMILHISTTGGFTMLLFFLLLHFLPTFCLSVTEAMLQNDGPDFDEVNHFENSDNTTMCLSTARSCSQVFDLVLIDALSHFMKFTFPGVTVQILLALPATV